MGKRYLKVPINMCKDIKEIDRTEKKVYVGFYSKVIDNKEILIDIIQTDSNNFYVRLIDVTGGKYEDIDFYEFKEKYSEPTLFDYFDL